MDFYQIKEKVLTMTTETSTEQKKLKVLEVYPDFSPIKSKDLMIRGRSFYAIWDEEKNMWSTDESDVQRLVDQDLEKYKRERKKTWKGDIHLKKMISFSSNSWRNYRLFVKDMFDTFHQLDENLTFSNTVVKKNDYVSKRLLYPLEPGSLDAYEEIMSTLYDPEERKKLEWAIGAIVSGDAKSIQKFIVLYGEAGSGKSTFLNIVQKLFEGYYTMFEAKALTNANNSFSTEAFRNNSLVAIQHDGDLSKIEDNTKLNSIISHEKMEMNEKYKSSYQSSVNAFLFLGTNKPVKITDAKSGVIRRLIDVRPSGRKIPVQRYYVLTNQIDFELGAIASHCLDVYKSMGKNYYSSYRPLEMMYQTDVFFNFVEDSYYLFKKQDGVSLDQAYDMYKAYCDEALVEYKLAKYKFREELKSYFKNFSDRERVEGKQVRSYYSGFIFEKFEKHDKEEVTETPYSLTLEGNSSKLDSFLSNCPAQYATNKETPEKKWSEVTTMLSDLDTTKLHYVKPIMKNFIAVDFDLRDENGKKSAEKNLEAASKWPVTCAEFSKSGAGIHLYYIYDGDVNKLSRVYDEGIEIKTFPGNSSLRRKLTKCNNSPVAIINSGLPLKGEKMVNFEVTANEKAIRKLLLKNLNKEYHPATKPSIDFIYKILEDANKAGVKYDVTDLRPKILAFANNSTNNSEYCVKVVNQMKFSSEEPSVSKEEYKSDELIFFDVEVFPNLFVVVWKKKGGKKVKMINPSASEVEDLFKFRLVGFNCRRYDNHILYARYVGYDNQQLFDLSQRIINGSKNAMFGEAYNVSYTDVYDFASSANKKSLKKFEIELGIHHQELGLPWDKPVPMELWDLVADYCGNDVDATESVFYHLSGDWAARQILAALSGLTVNDTTNQHSTKIIFGDNKHPQDQFVYTDLSTIFPGYTFDHGVSVYRGEETGEGGYVYAEPGMHKNVALLDVASMHPTSIEQLNLFGPYTSIFSDIKNGRISVKHEAYKEAKKLLNGRLTPFVEALENGTATYTADDLATALKTVINSVYGLTSARFDNPFKDPRNKDNIVAKRGALFMIDLKHAVQEQGYKVAHIKTDSIKIPDASNDIINFVIEFGKKYGYTFEHEATYAKMCLVNNAVYIAKYDDQGIRTKGGKHANEWTATGAQFDQSYVFKTLFSHEPIAFEDLCETKSVTSALYLDMNETLPEGEHDYHFIGKTGAFCPILSGKGGGLLCREKDGKYYSATGAKGYRWMEAEMVKVGGLEDSIDRGYYNALVDSAVSDISKFGDFEWFISDAVSEETNPIGFDETPPWECPKDAEGNRDCFHCVKFKDCELLPF